MATQSLVRGATDTPLSTATLSDLIRNNASQRGGNTGLISGGSNHTFRDLDQRSARVARGLISLGVGKGEHVGVLLGNCVEYVDLFLSVGRIGRVLVALNPTDSAEDLCRAVAKRSCKVLFIATRCGSRSLDDQIERLVSTVLRHNGSALEHVFVLKASKVDARNYGSSSGIETFERFLTRGDKPELLEQAEKEEKNILAEDVLTLQFTSGTTGEPKAAILTHHGVINNALHLSSRMSLSDRDTLCCPAALFRTFGIIMGFLTAFSRGTTVVFPSEGFDPATTVASILDEKCTALLGEYRLFGALLDQLKEQNRRIETLRTCLAAGAVVPVSMREAMRREMGIEDFVIAHGQTEIGPMVFITAPSDPKDTQSVGRIMPHRVAKVIDDNGRVVSRGVKGELCVGGYGLLKGYYADEVKTQRALKRDEETVLWFHTGDEASIDEEGYCFYGGRLGDIITLSDGSRVYPTEVEERLMEHEKIEEASVVPVKAEPGQERTGNSIGAFLRCADSARPADDEVREWVEQSLGSQKVPQHLFWIGSSGVGEEIPKTYNGKPQKRKMSEIASTLLRSN